ncbi:Na+/alanine symporter [Photobacterium damselae]|nr:Na+/alanine symporter [Photobacterium damselae]
MNPLHDTIFSFLKAFDNLVWGPPLLILLVGTGMYLTFRLGFIQIRYLPLALRYVFGGKKIKTPKAKVMFPALQPYVLPYLPLLVQVILLALQPLSN